MTSPKNICTSNIMQAEKTVFMYLETYLFVYTYS